MSSSFREFLWGLSPGPPTRVYHREGGVAMTGQARIVTRVPDETLAWLLEPENPAVAWLARRTLLGETDSPEISAARERRNDYEPVAQILDAQLDDGSWAPPARDYAKYGGSLWQIIFLGELWADGSDPRVRLAADYAFSRQLPDGSWSCTNKQPRGSIPCLTANVGRSLARLGYERDERVVAALAQVAGVYAEYGSFACPPGGTVFALNGYCHMLTPKVLLFLGAVPLGLWPDGARELRDGAVAALRDKEVFRSLPQGARDFADQVYSAKPAEREGMRERYLAEHGPLVYGDKPGWRRFGYPLSYNSDALEALWALAGVGETRRPEYEAALDLVESAADDRMRWKLRNTFNGRMIADVEAKGEPSKWLTLRALQVLEAFGA